MNLVDWKGHPWLALVMRLYLGGLFISASWHKILEPSVFAVDVATYQFLPLSLVNLVAITLPWIELIAGALLIIGLRVRAAALLVVSMMAAFMIALGWALHLELDMACGCFASQAASDEDPISYQTLLRDSVWLLQGLYVVHFDRRPLGIERLFNQKERR